MKTIILLTGLYLLLFQSCTNLPKEKVAMNRQRLFSSERKFSKDSLAHAEKPEFDDNDWRTLDIPHNWSIEDLPNQTPDSIIGPFSKASDGGNLMGYSIGGIGWYRKHFMLDQEDQGKQVTVVFDGVMTESDVWINGHHLTILLHQRFWMFVIVSECWYWRKYLMRGKKQDDLLFYTLKISLLRKSEFFVLGKVSLNL